MRKLTALEMRYLYTNKIVCRREPGELKHLITRRKRK